LRSGGRRDEEHGETWFGALAWSGSWRITVEQDQLDKVRVTGGFNPFDFGYVLKPGEKLETPIFYGGYSAHGLGGASRLLHRFELSIFCRGRRRAAPQAAAGDLQLLGSDGVQRDEAGQEALAEKAAALGIDRFVMDDGWFGQRKTTTPGWATGM
jgi:alpha-galactosidase